MDLINKSIDEFVDSNASLLTPLATNVLRLVISAHFLKTRT